jgi:hypothetical protein
MCILSKNPNNERANNTQFETFFLKTTINLSYKTVMYNINLNYTESSVKTFKC